MSDENEKGEGNWLTLIEEINLPNIVAGRAGKALSRIIGAAVDIPAAKLESISQRTKNETEARSIVTRAIAGSVAEKAKSDPAVIDRAFACFGGDLVRKQENREAVVAVAITTLQEERAEESITQEEVDEDWLNTFGDHAGRASSEKMRGLWGRILAGEIRKPKSFSLKTLSVLSTLEVEVARAFEAVQPYVVNNDYIPNTEFVKIDVDITDILLLEEYGLISTIAGHVKRVSCNDEGEALLYLVEHGLFITSEPADKITVRSFAFTIAGRELLKIVDRSENIEVIEALKQALAHKAGMRNEKITKMEKIKFKRGKDELRILESSIVYEKSENK